MMEAEFEDDLRLLTNALRQETFRFILIGHNRYSLYVDIAARIRSAYPDRTVELRLTGKDYRQITDEIIQIDTKIVLIPDFGWLFRTDNEDTCVAFNQRRDAFAKLNNAYICFIEPNEFTKVADKVPDWWSLRSLELDFHRGSSELENEFNVSELEEIPSFNNQSNQEKEKEIIRIIQQIELTNSNNNLLLSNLYLQVGKLFSELSLYDNAEKYLRLGLLSSRQANNLENESTALNNIGNIYLSTGRYNEALDILFKSLEISRQIKDLLSEGAVLNNISQVYLVKGDYKTALFYLNESLNINRLNKNIKNEGVILNNISQLYSAQGDYETAIIYLEKSLDLRRQAKDKIGESAVLNNMSQFYSSKGDYTTALNYLKDSLAIIQQNGSMQGESATLNNIGEIYRARGEYSTAIYYLKQSLAINQEIGDRRHESITLNNISQIYSAQGDYTNALEYVEKSLIISQQIGDKYMEAVTLTNLAAIDISQHKRVTQAVPLLERAYNILIQIGSPKSEIPKSYLNAIREQVGEEQYNQLIEST